MRALCFSPFYLVYGRQPKLPIDAALTYYLPLHFIDMDSYPHEVQRFFTQAITIANENIKQAQDRYKSQYDTNARNIEYKIGDMIVKDSHVGGYMLITR